MMVWLKLRRPPRRQVDSTLHTSLAAVLLSFTAVLTILTKSTTMTTDARTWNVDIIPFHDLSSIDGQQASRDHVRVRPGQPYESNPFDFIDTPPTPITASNVFATPVTSPTTSSSATRLPSATFISPTQVPTGPSYPENSVVPVRPPRGYFNYETNDGTTTSSSSSSSSSSLYGPGHPVMEYTTDGFQVRYADNMWGENWEPPYNEYDWDEFGNTGWGPWSNTLTHQQLRTNNLCAIGTNQSPIDVRLSGVACVETHQIRILVRHFFWVCVHFLIYFVSLGM
jgi:hypothetical protein